jgi:hypothetical protein
MPCFSHAVRTESDPRRKAYAPQRKYRAAFIGRSEPRATHADYEQDYGYATVRYRDVGIHGDCAPSLSYSERTFFPQWPVC